eukprot:TRINITY_DN2883_c0_g1_i2.p1 TRINITY_DN2883_c0_g1~~TRINITY_DN2883_c0_g1_i2.p1  ORF type:complete len:421 (-),score=82.26 TRINITY_DN2883_c0_g1_i2:1060-2322(-)
MFLSTHIQPVSPPLLSISFTQPTTPHHALKGRVVVHELDSEILKGNPLGDPSLRKLHVYLPPGYSPTTGYPVLMGLAGLFGSGESFFNGDGDLNLCTRMDRLILSYKCMPVIIVAPDCDTKTGGSQYINSEGTGRYKDYILFEVIPFIQKQYNIPNHQTWGVFGVSSGGYGALTLAMNHPEVFSCVASHSGDGLFDFCFKKIFQEAINVYRNSGGVYKWYHDIYLKQVSVNKGGRPNFGLPIVALGMSVVYSPNPHSDNGVGCDFPFSLETGEFLPHIWSRWTKEDPVFAISKNIDKLRKLKCIYLDAGRWDEFNLQHATRNIFHQLENEVMGGRRESGEMGLGSAVGGSENVREGPVLFFEEYDSGHYGFERRFDISIPMLAHALHMQGIQPRIAKEEVALDHLSLLRRIKELCEKGGV